MAKRGRPRKVRDDGPLSSAPQDPTVAPIESIFAQVSSGPTFGYQDADDGKVRCKIFHDGALPLGWFDTPALCENCSGETPPDYE